MGIKIRIIIIIIIGCKMGTLNKIIIEIQITILRYHQNQCR